MKIVLKDILYLGYLLGMRGRPTRPISVLTGRVAGQMVSKGHPGRCIKSSADRILASMEGQLDLLYAQRGRPSIHPERSLEGQLLIGLFFVRSERMFCEQFA